MADDMKDRAAQFTAATSGQTRILAILLVVSTFILSALWFVAFDAVERVLQQETSVTWDNVAELKLSPGPVFFAYDQKTKKLKVEGLMDQKAKRDLYELVPTDNNFSKEIAEYRSRIDEMVVLANKNKRRYFLYLLLATTISGVMGVQIRSLVNFVKIACFGNRLDVKRWWPWYLVRPVAGGVLGGLSVLFVQSGLVVTTGSNASDFSWWLGLAALVGIGVEDFVERLRQVSQALFGRSDK